MNNARMQPDQRHINALIAKHIMHWSLYQGAIWRDGSYYYTVDAHAAAGGVARWLGYFVPATHLDYAWQLVDIMQAHGWNYVVGNIPAGSSVYASQHYAMFMRGTYDIQHDAWEVQHVAPAGTVPLAICLAALQAVGVDPQTSEP